MLDMVARFPDGLAEMAPGRRLAAILSTLDPARLNGWQLVVLLEAQNRQLAHDQARLLSTVRELSYAPPSGPDSPPRRQAKPNPFVSSEISFALSWSEYAGGWLADVALACLDRLPALHEAMLAGRVDLPKVRLLCAELVDADDEHARRVIDVLMPELDRCSTTQLRGMLRRILFRLDPHAVRKRRTRALTQRAVAHFEYHNGTAALSGSNLAVDKAAAAYNHLDGIARATKATGDPRTLDQIRADTFTDLLSGIDPVAAGTAKAAAARKSTIELHIDLATLAMLSEEPGDLSGYGPILADIARHTAAHIAEQAAWRFTVTQHGTTLAEGRLTPTAAKVAAGITALSIGPDGHLGRRPTAAQDAYVKARDRTCRAPGCTRRAERCDLDHIDEHHRSHNTSICNLCALCKRHHRAKHIGLHKLRRGAHGIDWTTPHQHHYTVIPHNSPPPSPLERLLADITHNHHPSKLRR
jgi:Domain of unknown function (DUF222)